MTMVVGLVLIIALFGMCILTFVLMPKRGSPEGDEGQDDIEEGILNGSITAALSVVCAVLGLIFSGLLGPTIYREQSGYECVWAFFLACWGGIMAMLFAGFILGITTPRRWGVAGAAICAAIMLADVVFLTYILSR